MTSNKQLVASRRNAKLSTGPKDTSVTRFNSIRHGILAREALITTGEGAEDAQAFVALLEDLRRDLEPSGALAELLVEKLAIILWRWRRVVRYESGAIREEADDAVADWAKAQRDASRSRLEDKWTSTEDLEADLQEMEDYLASVSQTNPLEDPQGYLVYALAEYAEFCNDIRSQHGLRTANIKALLGLRGAGDWRDFDLREATREELERFYSGLCQSYGWRPHEGWTRIRDYYQHRAEQAKETLGRRQREVERVRLLASLPKDPDLDKVTRYEAHLSRELARTLAQLQGVALLTQGLEDQSPALPPRELIDGP